MLKNPPRLSFRGAAGDEESRKSFASRARFLASLGMTTFTKVFQHPASAWLKSVSVRTWLRPQSRGGRLPPTIPIKDIGKGQAGIAFSKIHAPSRGFDAPSPVFTRSHWPHRQARREDGGSSFPACLHE